MRFYRGQTVILLTIDGKPANGKAVIEEVDEADNSYAVKFFLTDNSPGELITRVAEGRLLPSQQVEVR